MTAEASEEWEPWVVATSSAAALDRALPALRVNLEPTVEAARIALSHVEQRQDAIDVLRFLSVRFIKELLDSILEVSLADTETLNARELLGRLPFGEAQETVPPAVWKLLDKEDDELAYRRMAGLLDHLGLYDALKQLCTKAYEHIDPDVREIASDYSSDN
ncbi:hypothetical protein [Amycolatopsis sp. H20-H5]|uniref:hypothetical protein n=1 Tax=Amycolatopsis sp. H20-H5 TaxID=3046309 RepID=UPI002DBB5F30|nr:hypothetical protein [Amycolatopsis sp. H20-H5]MEC3977171.1 hypothetical protein [Amycolatopsis sp. H20-H5]